MSVYTHTCEYALMQVPADPEAGIRCLLHLVFLEGLLMYLELACFHLPWTGLTGPCCHA